MIDFDEFDLELELDITGAYELDNSAELIEETCNNSYPFLINDLLKFIEIAKESDTDLSLVEIIVQYSFKNSIDLRLIGDAIQDDEYLKSFIKKDSEFHGLLNNRNIQENW